MKRSTAVAIWIGVALAVGAIGGGLAGSSTAMRVANALLSAGLGYLGWRSLCRQRTAGAVLLGLLAVLFAVLVVKVSWTAPIYDVLGSIVEEL